MAEGFHMPTDDSLARDLANEISWLSGIADDVDGLMLDGHIKALDALTSLSSLTSPQRGEMDITLFEGIFAMLKGEAMRIRLRASLSAYEAAFLQAAVGGAAREICRQRRERPPGQNRAA